MLLFTSLHSNASFSCPHKVHFRFSRFSFAVSALANAVFAFRNAATGVPDKCFRYSENAIRCVRDAVRVIMQSESNATITYQVIDMKGTVLATQKTSVTAGRNEVIIPAASLAKGIYVLKVIENNTTQTIRFVKE